MNRILKFIFLLLVTVGAADAEMGPPVVYEVTATSLKVRVDSNTKSKVLYVIPQGGYVYDDGGDSSKPNTIDGISGKWIAQFDGYVFSGYLKPTKRPIRPYSQECSIGKNSVECDEGGGKKSVYEFSATTPLSGSWLQYDDQTGCKVISAPNVFEKSPKRLAAAVAHGDVYWVYEPRANGGKVLQFIVRVRGRGAC